MNANDQDGNANATEEQEILRLDPAQRLKLRRIIAGIVIGVIVLGLLIHHWMNLEDRYLAMHRILQMVYLLSVALFAAGGYLGWYARRIWLASQYPPPAGWILGDTRVLRGDAARIQARWIAMCAVVFAAFAIYAGFLAHSIAAMRIVSVEQMPPPPAIAPHG